MARLQSAVQCAASLMPASRRSAETLCMGIVPFSRPWTRAPPVPQQPQRSVNTCRRLKHSCATGVRHTFQHS